MQTFFLQQDRLRTKGQTKASFLSGMLNLKGRNTKERKTRKGNNPDKKFFWNIQAIRSMTKCLLLFAGNQFENHYFCKIVVNKTFIKDRSELWSITSKIVKFLRKWNHGENISFAILRLRTQANSLKRPLLNRQIPTLPASEVKVLRWTISINNR